MKNFIKYIIKDIVFLYTDCFKTLITIDPCKKCLIVSMCSHKCDSKNEYIKRVLWDTYDPILNKMSAFVFITSVSFAIIVIIWLVIILVSLV